MKKLLYFVVVLCGLTLFVPRVLAKEVNLYMFSMYGCENCAKAEEFFNEKLKENPDAFNFTIIEVVKNKVFNKQAQDLMAATLEHFEQKVEYSFPLLVVGDNFHVGANSLSDVYEIIENAQTDDNYKDVVKELADTLEINIKDIERLSEEEIEKKESNSDAIILVVIFVVLIGGFAGLIYLGKK